MTDSSTVDVGAPTDTGPTYTVTITRDPADTVTDWTTATVALEMPDGTTQPVTQTSATASQWVGAIRYNAWFASPGVYVTRARATFADGTRITVPSKLAFSVGAA